MDVPVAEAETFDLVATFVSTYAFVAACEFAVGVATDTLPLASLVQNVAAVASGVYGIDVVLPFMSVT